MVDIIKLPSNRPFFEQISVSLLHSDAHRTDCSSNKHWIGRCLGDPPRPLPISDLPSLQRSMIDQEMSRCYSITVDTSTSMKIKPLSQQQQQQQRNSNRESLKVTTVTWNSILSNFDETQSCLFKTLSKHFTIKAEPLRPVTNNFVHHSQSSWQKTRTSTNSQRKRKETNDHQLPLIHPKHDQSGLTTPHSQDSSLITELSTSVESDKQSSSSKAEDRLILPPIVSKTSPMNSPKSSATVDGENTNEMSALTSKIYKLPLPSKQQKPAKTIPKTRSKSLERKPILPSSIFEKKETKPPSTVSNTRIPKRKFPILSNKSHRLLTKTQQQSLARVMTTTPRSKYTSSNWFEPYVGARFDPPTPPSSPSYLPWSQINDQYSNETPYKLNSVDEIY